MKERRKRIFQWVLLLLMVGFLAIFLYTRIPYPFPSNFTEDAILQWQESEKKNQDITQIALKYFRPGMSISECESLFASLGLKANSGYRQDSEEKKSEHLLVGYYTWSSTKFNYMPEAVVSVVLTFSSEKLIAVQAQVIKNKY